MQTQDNLKIEEEKAPNKPRRSPMHYQKQVRDLKKFANSNYQVFETEPTIEHDTDIFLESEQYNR